LITWVSTGGAFGIGLPNLFSSFSSSAEEQNALIYAFQSFLNGIDFSLEVVIQSRRLSIDPYLKYLEGLIPQQRTELLKLQTQDYIQFVRGLIELQNVMSKSFYVVVPMSQKPAQKLVSKGPLSGLFSKKKTFSKTTEGDVTDENFKHLRGQLTLRVEQTLSGLRGMSIEARQLDSEELFYLFANLYSPGVLKKKMPISGAIEGFN
jgi:hypothetical protein